MREHLTPPNFSRPPMLWLAVAFATGILAANCLYIDLPLLLGACVVFAAAAVLVRKHQLASYAILIAFAAAGASSLQAEKLSLTADRVRVLYDSGAIRSGDPVEIEGVLMGGPEPSIDGVFLNLRSENITHRGERRQASGNVRLFLPQPQLEKQELNFKSEISDVKYGSRIRVACRLIREDAFLNPGVMPRNELLDRLAVDATGSIKSLLLVEHLADESVFLPLAWVYDQRAALIETFRVNLSPAAAGVMNASLLGDKYFLDKDTADVFREGGTFHILVISGLHITFIGGLLLFLVMRLTQRRWIQFGVTAAVLWAYTLAVGADVPVVRAAIMFTVVSFSYVIYRQGSLLNALGVCGLILLVWRPSDLFNPSFQLTFVSVAAILAAAHPLLERLRSIGAWRPTPTQPFPPNVPEWLKRFCETLYWREDAWRFEAKRQIWSVVLFKSPFMANRITGFAQTVARYVLEAVLVSLVVQLCMLPLLVVYFNRVSVASVLLNLWVGLFIALESFSAILGALAGYVSTLLAAPFFLLAEVFNWLMLALPRSVSGLGWASFRLPAYSGDGRIVYVLYFIPLLIFVFALNRWKPFDLIVREPVLNRRVLLTAAAVFFVLCAIVVFHPLSAPRPDGRLHIDFLDVGQGDSALVTFPDGRTLLVDGGGQIRYRAEDETDSFEPDTHRIGETVVSPFLWHRGYSTIDHILATHAHADHMQGLGDVARNFSARTALLGHAGGADFAELNSVLKKKGIPVDSIARGDRLLFGDVIVEVLYPPADASAVSANESSVVLRIVHGSRAFLLTGDIESGAEARLVASGGTLAADVVKVAHHGSRTSSTRAFVERTGAKYAVISVGRSSPFGHPHAEIVDRWRATGAMVLTTGTSGTISVSTDGRDLTVDRYHVNE